MDAKGCRMDVITSLFFISMALPVISIAHTFTFVPKTKLSNILVTKYGVFAGAMNQIHRLNSNLAELKSEITGPANDSKKCVDRSEKCKTATLTNNWSTLLLMLESSEASGLITCGSLFQGSCQLRNPINLNIKVEGSRSVSANDNTSTTVAFIKNSNFYVAVTQVERPETSHFPSVSVRPLTKFSPKSFLEIAGDAKFEVERGYIVDYISGFAYGQFAFFTAVQLKENSISYHSKIIRHCLHAGSFHSYTEIPLSCKDASGSDYNILVAGALVNATEKTAVIFNVSVGKSVYIGIFSKSLPGSKEKTENNTVCVFSMEEAGVIFKQNIKRCVVGGLPVNGGIPWVKSFDGRQRCVEAMKEYKKQMANSVEPDHAMACHDFRFERDFPQGGHIPLNYTRSFKISALVSAFRIYLHDRGLALFLGTVGGKLLRFSVSPSLKTHMFGQEMVSEGSPIKQIKLGVELKTLYTMSAFKVAKYSVNDCNKRLNCVDCLEGPFCGWCSLANKCCFRNQCNFSERPLYFINDTSSKCPSVASFKPQPAAVSVRQQSRIIWKINYLPTLLAGQTYSCSFGSVNATVTATGNEYSCLTPKFGDIHGTDSEKSSTVAAVFRSPEQSTALFTIDIDFFNCEKIHSCLECTRFKYKCNWCPSTLTCLDVNKKCKHVVPHAGPDQSIELSKCPMVRGIATSFISSGANREVIVRGLNLLDYFPYQCKILVDGNQITVPARRGDDKTLKCSEYTYVYKSNDARYSAPMTVLFGGKVLDQISEFNVTFYKCKMNRDSCGVCLDAPEEWNCGWCNKKKCTVSDNCPAGKQWANVTCPSPPAIHKFTPSIGAIYGNMVLKIEGRELGTMSKDVANITVAGVSCQFLTGLYVTSKAVYCTTGAAKKPVNGTVQMFVRFGDNMVKVVSKRLMFMYKKPIVAYFEPTKGPCSGGTELTIFGSDLHVGSNVSVSVPGGECNLNLRVRPNRITCTITSRCPSRRRRAAASDGIVVSFDGQAVTPSTSTVFSVEPDPIITSVNTYSLRTADSEKLETFVSGGQVFIVKGERFDLIQKPSMKFKIFPQKVVKVSTCELIDPGRLDCISPNVTEITGMLNNSEVVVELGFSMQKVQSVKVVRNITVKGDPFFYHIDGVMDLQLNNLYLKGRNLYLLGNEDVNVTVAGLRCVVQNIRERLFCTFPDKNELEKKLQGKKGLVKVKVGLGGLAYTLGYVRYVKMNDDKPFPWLYVYIAAAIGAVFIVVIIILGILYRRRQKKEKQYQKVNQTRLENLESMYARECKEAFAELQIEMTDLTTDMSTASIPYLKFESYAMRLLFPALDTHPVMEKDCNKSDTWKRCMSSLCELLKEKEFLLIFIKTLEGQNSFAMRDRCKMASLLIVALQDDIKYVTDILQELLSDLIQRSVESGRAKLLLRRTESVAEKLLTNWLSYTLHEFLKHRVGEPLFRLLSALITLLDKEPVDVIACEARNSLSEDRLLRQKVDFKTITAHVEYDGGDMIQVQLLDCDSIDQAKDKILKAIYRNVPFSQRPSKDSLVLVYQTPTGGEKILHQEDSTCEIDGEWKKINTLEHFLIPDGCQLKLMPFSIYSDGTGTPVFHDTSLPNVNFAPTHSSTPMLNNHYDNGSFKRWHLVKTSEYPTEQKGDVRQNKMMAEIYLTRLLKTKGTLQNFVNDLFESVFAVTVKGETIPPAMKFLFDFLDKQAALLNITENEVLHTWKNNCLPLKFWINVIKNPNFIFDINKTSIVDSCLSVIAQLFMDACSPEEHRLGKDSPSNKLLYAKEIPEYKKKVARFYSEVKMLPSATDKELNESLSHISDIYGETFNHYNAASEVLSYAVKYKVKVMDALEAEDLEEYASKLQDIMADLPDD